MSWHKRSTNAYVWIIQSEWLSESGLFLPFFFAKTFKQEKNTKKKDFFSFDSNIFIISGFLQNATLPKGFGVNSTGNFLDL